AERGRVEVGTDEAVVGAEQGALDQLGAGADGGTPDDVVLAHPARAGQGGGDGRVRGGGHVRDAVGEARVGQAAGAQGDARAVLAFLDDGLPERGGGVVDQLREAGGEA